MRQDCSRAVGGRVFAWQQGSWAPGGRWPYQDRVRVGGSEEDGEEGGSLPASPTRHLAPASACAAQGKGLFKGETWRETF